MRMETPYPYLNAHLTLLLVRYSWPLLFLPHLFVPLGTSTEHAWAYFFPYCNHRTPSTPGKDNPSGHAASTWCLLSLRSCMSYLGRQMSQPFLGDLEGAPSNPQKVLPFPSSPLPTFPFCLSFPALPTRKMAEFSEPKPSRGDPNGAATTHERSKSLCF